MREKDEEILARWAEKDKDVEEELERTSAEKKHEIAEELRRREAEDEKDEQEQDEIEEEKVLRVLKKAEETCLITNSLTATVTMTVDITRQ